MGLHFDSAAENTLVHYICNNSQWVLQVNIGYMLFMSRSKTKDGLMKSKLRITMTDGISKNGVSKFSSHSREDFTSSSYLFFITLT